MNGGSVSTAAVGAATGGGMWENIGKASNLFAEASPLAPYLKAGKFLMGAAKLWGGAKQKTKESKAKIRVIDDQLGGLQQSMRDLGAATEAKKEVGRSEFDTGVTQLGRSTSYGMEDITGASQSAAKKSGLISGDWQGEQRRERTTEAYGAQIQKQEDVFSREMMAIDEMYSTEANKIDAQTKSLQADRKKLEASDDFWENMKSGLLGG